MICCLSADQRRNTPFQTDEEEAHFHHFSLFISLLLWIFCIKFAGSLLQKTKNMPVLVQKLWKTLDSRSLKASSIKFLSRAPSTAAALGMNKRIKRPLFQNKATSPSRGPSIAIHSEAAFVSLSFLTHSWESIYKHTHTEADRTHCSSSRRLGPRPPRGRPRGPLRSLWPSCRWSLRSGWGWVCYCEGGGGGDEELEIVRQQAFRV